MPPETPPATRTASPQASQQMLMLLLFLGVMLIFFIPEARTGLGVAASFVLEPLIGFGGHFPVLSIFLAGAIPLVISVILRHFMVDWVAQARMAEINRALGKEIREAMQKRNTARMKKLNETRSEVMKEFLPLQMAQMKPTAITMFLFVVVFAWLSTFVGTLPSSTVAVPWALNAPLTAVTVLPHWILLYSVLTLPLSLVLSRVLKYFTFSHRLEASGEGTG